MATGEQSIGQAEAVKETPKDRPRAPNLVLNAAQAQKEVAKPAVKDGKGCEKHRRPPEISI